MRITRATHLATAFAAASLVVAACGGSDDATTSSTEIDPPILETSTAVPVTADVVPTTAPGTTNPTTAPASTLDVADEGDWLSTVADTCVDVIALLQVPDHDGTAEGFMGDVAALTQALDRSASLTTDVPLGRQDLADVLDELAAEAAAGIAMAEDSIASGDLVAAGDAVEQATTDFSRMGGQLLAAGVGCGVDSSVPASAALNVALPGRPTQLDVGFDSVWVNAEVDGTVERIDPDTGEIVATIDVGRTPLKLQPADGRMWVRTADRYVAIDPATNTVTAELAKADVGQFANRAWAVDGGLWICDGTQVHRYDPTTVELVATIDTGVDCGQVYATDDLVVAWNYNEDFGQSGTTVATFIDPVTNAVLAGVALPADVEPPIVLTDVVFFPGDMGSSAVVVDRATWDVVATPAMGRSTRCSMCAYDGSAIYVSTADSNGREVLVVDATTFAVTDTIATIGANSLAVTDGSLWVVDGVFGVLQRFDVG